jgi:hypothetical protein
MNAAVMKAKFDLLFAEAEENDLVDVLNDHLEKEYDLFDIDRARDIIGSESP